MGSVLIANGDVVPVSDPILTDGWVLIVDGVITEVGTGHPHPQADETIDASGCVVVPGFVNGHQHHWYNLFKGLGEGMLLERWITDLLVPSGAALSADDLRVASKLACLEMLRSGTTTCLNHQVTTTDQSKVDAILASVAETGMRQVFAKEIRAHDLSDQLALAESVFHQWNGVSQGRIKVAFAVESTAHWVALGASSEELMIEGDKLAGRLGTTITDHIAGGTMSRNEGYLKFLMETGRTDIQYLHRLGVLNEKWLLAHTIYPTDGDLDLISDAGASVVHTPTSEASRAAGITPVRRMIESGINVGLGTDGPMVDTSVDMLEQIKAVRLFQNQLHLDPMAVSPMGALQMATLNSAKAVGLEEQIGSLQPGKRGDVAVFDLNTPWSTVSYHPVGALVHSARGLDARHVLVDGEVLVADGSFVRHDDAEILELLAEARSRSRQAVTRAGLDHLIPAI